MKTFAYDQQLQTMPDVVMNLIANTDAPSLNPHRTIIFSGIGTSLHAARLAADWMSQLGGGKLRAIAADARDDGRGGRTFQRR